MYFNNPKNYNDPFDSIIDFDDKDIEKSMSIIAEYYIIQEFLKLLNNKDIKVMSVLKVMSLMMNILIRFVKV